MFVFKALLEESKNFDLLIQGLFFKTLQEESEIYDKLFDIE